MMNLCFFKALQEGTTNAGNSATLKNILNVFRQRQILKIMTRQRNRVLLNKNKPKTFMMMTITMMDCDICYIFNFLRIIFAVIFKQENKNGSRR